MKILVVDDDMVTGVLLKKVLSKQGYEVTHVVDGTKALEILQKTSFRIVLTDWMMPEMDGPTLCRHIRELKREQYVYIILLTAKSSKDDAVSGLEAGADDYIVKPFDKHELLARIRAGCRLIDLEDSNRKTQQKLLRTEKMAAVGHLAAGVAHEINNPIGFINSNLNSLGSYIQDMTKLISIYRKMVDILNVSITQKTMHANLPKMVQHATNLEKKYDIDFTLEDSGDLIHDCLGGAERIKNIVHEMRYFAHPEKQSIENICLPSLFKKIVSQMEQKIPSGVNFDYHLENLPKIPCNAPHIEKAFTNLVQNAIDAIEEDGQITIRGKTKDTFVELVVTDTGRGIAADQLSMIFDPFFTTKDVGQGLGLGLTTATNIIKMHNGSITYKSTPEKNTSFIVLLPTVFI